MVVKDTVKVTVEKRGFNVVVTITTLKGDQAVATNLQVEAKRVLIDDMYSEPREQTVFDSRKGIWPPDQADKEFPVSKLEKMLHEERKQ